MIDYNISVPVGIIDVFWDYDDFDTLYKVFFEFNIKIENNGKFEFVNKFYFLDHDLCEKEEEIFSNELSVLLLDYNEKNKIELSGNILFLNKKQYEKLNNFILKNSEKYKFKVKYENKSQVK